MTATLDDLIKQSNRTTSEIAQMASMSTIRLQQYIDGEKLISNMQVANAYKLANALAVTIEELMHANTGTKSKEISITSADRLSNFISCTDEYRRITQKNNADIQQDTKAVQPELKPEPRQGPYLQLPDNTSIGEYYLKACLLRKYFVNDDAAILPVLQAFKKLLSEKSVNDYDEDIVQLEEQAQRIIEGTKKKDPNVRTPESLLNEILYSTSLHGDLKRGRFIHPLPQQLIDFIVAQQVELREHILRGTYANIMDACEKGIIEIKLTNNNSNSK